MEESNDCVVTLVINGKKVGLNPYVKSVYVGVVLALAGTLKNVDEPKKIEITVEKKS
jgi:hypothetical protein